MRTNELQVDTSDRRRRGVTAFRKWLWCTSACLAISSNALADAPGDIDGDGDVDFDDFIQLPVFQFGPETPTDSPGEITQSALENFGLQQAEIKKGCLHILGTADDSTLALRLRSGAPFILEVDIENDGTADFSFNRKLFKCILVNGLGGDDTVFIDESNGLFTDTETTTLHGGTGDDTLIGGSGAETFIGGPGHDSAFMGAGGDRFIWNPGDDNDVVNGIDGVDTVEVNGGSGAEVFTVTANGTRVRFDRLNPTPFFIDIGSVEKLVFNAGAGDDWFACTGNLAALIQITADGGAGADTLLGGNGADLLIGGDGDDFIDGNQGADTVLLGAGNDTFQWDPGDGNDIVEGQDDQDAIVFNGSAAGEIFDFSSNGPRLRFTRNVGAIVLDADGIELFDLRALGGADSITMNSLAGTTVKQVNIDLAGTLSGVSGDALADTVNIAGTPGPDIFSFSADGGFVKINLPNEVRVKGYEALDQFVVAGVGGDLVNVNGAAGPDTMTVISNGTQARVDVTGYSAAVAVSGALALKLNGLGGSDSMSCTGNLAGLAIPITLDGGGGGDTLLGSNGPDVLIGGDDSDFIDGNQGSDVAFLGAGDDTFQWDPGDGNDLIEGQADFDVIAFNGSGAAELLECSANGQRLRFTRNIGNIILDADGIEQFDLQALGGADIVTVNNLAGTAVTQVNVDLASTLGGVNGDGQLDNVIVNSTNAGDTVGVAGGVTGALVTGLAAVVTIATAEAANDRLTVNTLGGNDTVQATGLPSGVIGLTLNGGLGDDVLVGSGGGDALNGDDDNDTITGGEGDDTVQLGAGSDTFAWNSGDDTDIVDGGDGIDTLEVNGGNGDEDFTVTANGTRVRFDRIDSAPFFIDLGTLEKLVLNANAGDDFLACTGNLAALIQITADGGPGDDTLLGSNGNDLLIGGNDDDFIDGNQGVDTALLGAGNDTFQWDPGDGNDIVEGQADQDTIVFNGSATSEIFSVAAHGQRLRFTRNVANIVLDADGIERFDLRALGGADSVTVNSLAGTAITLVNIDLAGTLGGGSGDAQVDVITVNGTNAADTIHVAANSGAVEVAGLAALVRITHSQSINDSLVVNGLDGADAITSGPGVPALIAATLNQ